MSPLTVQAYTALVTLLTAVGCATMPATNGQPSPVGLTGRPTSATLLTREDIARVDAGTAYQAVLRLRPMYLKASRGPSPLGRSVYVDGVRLGGLEQLHFIAAGSVLDIRLLEAAEATLRFGMGHSTGAILVSTRAGP